MAKPKSPLLSLGARGTIGDMLTFQQRLGGSIVRKKPIPTDPYSLNQAYQRWDYRDYAHMWTLLSNSEKQVYRTKASRYHITGFSQYMREKLKTLPDIMGRWHLDEKAGAVAYDSSKNSNNGVIVGASPIAGVIDSAYKYDGVNDRITIPDHTTLQLPTSFSVEAFIKSAPPALATAIIEKGLMSGYPLNFMWYLSPSGNIQLWVKKAGIAAHWVKSFGVYADNEIHHLVSNFNTTQLELFADGVSKGTVLTGGQADTAIGHPLYIGGAWSSFYPGLIDELVIRDRELDQNEITRHSLRRYPVK